MSTPTDTAIAAALESTASADVLAHVLAAWRAYPSARLAELVTRASDRAMRERADRQETGTLEERQQQWLAIAATDDPLELPWLLANVMTSRGALTRERLQLLARLPDDPRITAALIAACAVPSLSTHGPVWTKVFAILGRTRDARVVALIEHALTTTSAVTSFDHEVRVRLRQLATLHAGRPALPPPHPREDLLGKLAARLGDDPVRVATAKTADDFLREIWASPEADGPREVFADWLIEHGDPRGELINLQFARARGTGTPEGLKRERVLLTEHHRAWIGELEPVVSKNAYVFERGFLFRADVSWRKLAALPALMTHPAWATVREYKLASEGERSCDRWLDHMIALRAKRI